MYLQELRAGNGIRHEISVGLPIRGADCGGDARTPPWSRGSSTGDGRAPCFSARMGSVGVMIPREGRPTHPVPQHRAMTGFFTAQGWLLGASLEKLETLL